MPESVFDVIGNYKPIGARYSIKDLQDSCQVFIELCEEMQTASIENLDYNAYEKITNILRNLANTSDNVFGNFYAIIQDNFKLTRIDHTHKA